MSIEKSKKRSALGMGLDALLPDNLQGDFFLCAVEDIRPSKSQPRKHFNAVSIEELAASIHEKGLIQPLVLRKLGPGEGYELIAGERRWRAAQKAGIMEVPAIIRQAEDDEVMELALVENLQREDLNPVDEARAYKLLMDTTLMTQEQIAARIGKSRVAVANAVRLLTLDPTALEALTEGKISAGHARALLSAPEQRRKPLLREIIERGLSVRQTEEQAKKTPRQASRQPVKKDPNLKALELRLSRALGTKVHLRPGKGKGSGSISVAYTSLDDLDRLMELFENIK